MDFSLLDRDLHHEDFVAADKLNTFKLLNKNLISPKRIMVLYSAVNFEQF